MSYQLVFTKQAQKDARKHRGSPLVPKIHTLLDILRADPFQSAPPFESLIGDLAGAHSRRINIQHRLVYQVLENHQTVKVLRMWSHYD